MKLDHIIKHIVIGGGTAAAISYAASEYIKTRDDWDEEKKSTLLGAAIGGTGAATAGYLVEDVVIDGRVPEDKKNKLFATVGLGLVGVFIGGYFGKKAGRTKMYYSSQQKAGEKTNTQQGGGA